MAFTLPLIGDFADLGLNDFQIGPGNARKIKAYVRTNLGPNDALIDVTSGLELLGDTPITILSNGTWSVDLLDTSSTDLNVEANTLQYELVAEYTSTGDPAKRVYRSGWFALTEADLELVEDVPMAVFSSLDLDLPSVTPGWRSAFAAEMETIRDETAVISGLTGEDAAVAFLVEDAGSDTSAALSATYAALPGAAAMAVEALPTFLYNPIEANAAAFGRSNVVTTEDGTQYAVWWNAGRRPVVGKRTLGGTWATYDLSLITGNPLAGPLVDDGHNSLAIARDANGYLHIVGNMHDMALRYVRSTAPDSITAWAAASMVGTQETSVTYPQLVTAADGELLFLYRNGSSIAGDLYLNAYNATTQTWTRRAHLLTGTLISGDTQNGYPDQIMVDPTTGDLAMFVVWRIGSTFLTTHDICYIKSADNGVTWTSIAGAALTLPIRPPSSVQGTAGSEAPIAFAHPPNSGAGLINQCGAVMDSEGRPHTARWLYDQADKTIYRLHHYYWDGAAWVDEVVRTVTGMTASTTGTIATPRPSLFTAPNGRTFIIWRNTILEPQTMWCEDVTPDQTRFPAFPLANVDLGGYEANFDYDAMRRGYLHMLLTPTYRDPNQVAGDENWFGQWGAVLSVDLHQIAAVAAGQASALGLEYARNDVTAATTSSTTRADGAKVPLADTRELVLARVTGNAKATTTAGEVVLEQRAMDKDTGTQLGSVAVAAGNRAAKSTPFLPLRPDLEDISAGAVAIERHAAGAGGSLDVPALGVDVARLRLGSRPLIYTGARGGTYATLGKLAAYWNIAGAGLANDTSVTTIADSSGNGRTLTNHAAGYEPLYKTAGINSVGALRFASSDALKTAAFALGNEYTILTVAASDATPATADEQQIICAWDSAAATPMIAQLRYNAAGSGGGTPPSISALSRTQLGGSNTVTEAITTPATPRLIAVRRYWSTYRFIFELWIDGVLVEAHSPTPSGGNPGATGAAPWYMGARYSGGAVTEYLGGYVGDTVMFDQYLNNAELRAGMARIARTYSITLP